MFPVGRNVSKAKTFQRHRLEKLQVMVNFSYGP